jgi:hypothetical protein
MKNTLVMTLFSRQVLTASLARRQIAGLSDFRRGLMRPEKWSEAEPIRTPFDPADIGAPVKSLSEPHGEFFYRKGSPVHLSGEIWNLTHPPTARFPSPLFVNYWTGRFDGTWAAQVGLENVQQFVSEMFQITGSDFGLLTTEVDLKAKNTNAKSYSYQGLKLEAGIPGLYWINFFSDAFANWLGLHDFPRELAVSNPLTSGGLSLKFCQSPEGCREIDILNKQKTAIDWLGPEKVFDIRFPARQLSALDWDQIATTAEDGWPR